ncbi:hypothetical protein J6590_025501 [Homalodisca vitripennis]|nr:hypothetical protein J6590_025501 [Homalodisca vitripennis]
MTARDSEIDCWVGYGSDDSVSVDINYAQLQGTPNCEESGEDDILGCFSPRPTASCNTSCPQLVCLTCTNSTYINTTNC